MLFAHAAKAALAGEQLGRGALLDDAPALEGRSHAFSSLENLLRELHRGVNKAHPCGAGLGLLAVSTDGNLGLCHSFVDSETHTVGSLEQGIDAAKREAFLREGRIETKTACHTCFVQPNCSAACYHEACVRYGDVMQPNLHYCSRIRSWTDLGLHAPDAGARTVADIPFGCTTQLDPGWEVDSSGGAYGLCTPIERDLYDCHHSCYWPAQTPDARKLYFSGRGHELVVLTGNYKYLKTVRLGGETDGRFILIEE